MPENPCKPPHSDAILIHEVASVRESVPQALPPDYKKQTIAETKSSPAHQFKVPSDVNQLYRKGRGGTSILNRLNSIGCTRLGEPLADSSNTYVYSSYIYIYMYTCTMNCVYDISC